MKHLPNLISCFRILLSVTLLFLITTPSFFIIVYLLCGLSDIADGYLARSLNARTNLGVKLDSLGDFVFYAVCFFVLFDSINIKDSSLIIICILVIAIVRIANLVITKLKFKQWNIMHTIGNKLTGFILFLVLPIYIFAHTLQNWCIIVAGLFALLSALEETAILIRFQSYDADRRSILSMKNRSRKNHKD